MFFSSGEQAGELQSKFLSGLPSLSNVEKTLPGTQSGLFLHDFFSKVLPRDRNLFTPILEYLKWKLFTRNLGMAAWLLVLFFVCGLMSLSYMGNLRAMNDLFDAFPERPVFSEDIEDRVVEMTALRQRIDAVHDLNSDWWVPRMGIDVSLRAEDRVEDYYCAAFREKLLDPFDVGMNTAIAKLTTKSSEQLTSEFVQQLVWRIDMLGSRLSGGGAEDLAKYQLPTGKALADSMKDFNPDLMEYFGQLYTAYLLWEENEEILIEQQLLLKARLAKVLSLKGADFKWLVDWANDNPVLHPVTLRDFWGGPMVPLGHDVYVLPAYTEDGREMLERFLAELKNAMQDVGDFDKKEKDFWAWYAGEYYNAWFQFADRFIEGEGQLLTKNDYRNMAARMATADNPYFALLERMKKEFMPLKDMSTPHNWVQQVFHFNIILAQYRASKAKGVTEASEKAEQGVRKFVADLGGKLAEKVEHRIEAAKKLEAYMAVLGDISHYADNQEDAFKSASALYPGGTSGGAAKAGGGASGKTSKSPIDAANQALSTLKSLMDVKGHGQGKFWDLVSGPLDYIVYVITLEAACELQQLWEGQVLAKVAHVPDNKLRESLFGKTGVVNKFTDGPAKPFLKRGAKGWGGRSWYGIPFPFVEDFYSFLDEGARGAQQIQPEYSVKLDTIPTTVNEGAKEDPYATLLEVMCGTAPQKLANFNFAESQTFKWKPQECGTTTLSIQFPGLELVKAYEGKLGFAKFLKEFEDGSVTFTPKDFPDQAKGLEGLGITSIQVGYSFQDATPVIDILDIKPVHLPDNITDCWQR